MNIPSDVDEWFLRIRVAGISFGDVGRWIEEQICYLPSVEEIASWVADIRIDVRFEVLTAVT
jgi:hypothetical protein